MSEPQEGRDTPAFRATHTRTKRIQVGSHEIDVDVTVAQNHDGSLAFYQRGTGPFTSNRAARRAARRKR